ncbi:MAG: MATE family efflux transporter [Solobacterium sp.]|nr:MATE family efflux transporter [Solobacterium sp.]
MEDNLLTHGDYRKKIIRFMIPILIGQLFQQMYNTADALIVGNFLNADALAAVASTSSLVFLVIGFCLGFSSGAGVIVSRHIGAKDEKQTSLAVHTSVLLGIVIGVLTTIMGVLFADDMLRLMDTPENIIDQAALYLRIYFGGSMSVVMYNMLVGIVQAAGDSKHPLYYLVVSSILNIILDIVFITVFHTGVEGPALATVIAQTVSMLLVLRQLLKADGAVRVFPSKLAFDSANLEEILRFGFPTAIQDSVIDLSNVMIQSYINSFGSAAVAGIGASTRAEGFGFLLITAFSIAITTFISQNIGAGEYERAKKGIRFTLVTAIVLIEAVGLIMFLFAPTIISAFSRSPEVIAFGTGRMRVCSLFYCMVGFSHISSAIMRGAGRPNVPLVVMLGCWCMVRVIILMTIGQTIHDIRLVYWIYPFTWCLSSILYIFFLRSTKIGPQE